MRSLFGLCKLAASHRSTAELIKIIGLINSPIGDDEQDATCALSWCGLNNRATEKIILKDNSDLATFFVFCFLFFFFGSSRTRKLDITV